MQEVTGSSPVVPTKFFNIRGYSTVGSAIRSQRIGQGFESPYLHHEISTLTGAFLMVVKDVNRSPKFGGSREQASGD